MNEFISINRGFITWSDEDERDPDLLNYLPSYRDSLTWADLLAKRRVVLLAEAGSGKSTELAEQAKLNAQAGRYTFSATVQNVGRRGLAQALGRAQAPRLEEWLNSEEPAWFFFDSVDEAKANDVRLEDALQAIADDIEGGQSRAHIVISGRYTDWEFRRDLARLKEAVPVPPEDQEVPALNPDELIVSVLRREQAPEPAPPAEEPLVVVMAPLDQERVRTFVGAKGITDVETFLEGLDKSDLWDFARRPLDLDWLVSFWRTRGTFGPLAEMIELSLCERLRETDPQRCRKDPLDADRAMQALERIGAGLVLQRLQDIAVPDSAFDLGARRTALDMAEILPDWSGQDRMRLINRAVFDPASAGCVRLHNDNQGVVSSYLTARWFKRLMDANCPKTAIRDVLFATTYGVDLVVPSIRQTAAWLSLWSPDIARQVIDCDPRLLMDAGDPASLPLAVREEVLRQVVQRICGDDTLDMPDRDSLKRFARPDLAPCIRDLWNKDKGSPAIRELLLLMIWLGEITVCSDIAVEASFRKYDDRYTQLFAGRALMAVASGPDKKCYAVYIRDNATSIDKVILWDAVDRLFPQVLSVEDLLLILGTVEIDDRDGVLGFKYQGPAFAERLKSRVDAEHLIDGLFALLEEQVRVVDRPAFRDKSYLPTLEAAGRRLLELTSFREAPKAAIDAAIRVVEAQRPYRRRSSEADNIFSLLQASPERRRAALWRAADRLAGSKLLKGRPITDVREIELFGFELGLQPEDLGWLIEDAEYRQAPNEREIAANAVFRLWRVGNVQSEQLDRLKQVGLRHPEVAAVIEQWTSPPSPSEEHRAHERHLRRLERRNAMDMARRDQSWLDLAAKLRADPNQLRTIGPPTEKGIDSRLYHLWQLLNGMGQNRSRFAISDLSPLVPMFGSAVVEALRDAFIAYWRHWTPTLQNERPVEERNTIRGMDCIGLVGITLEAARRGNWAAALSYDEAVRAAIYATTELNGFPSWFSDLARAQPGAVRHVLMRAIAPELAATDAAERCSALEDVCREDAVVCALVADRLFDHLRQHEEISLAVLRPLLRILSNGYEDKVRLAALLRKRFDSTGDLGKIQPYFIALFDFDPSQAVVALETELARLPVKQRTQLVQDLLGTLFSWRSTASGERVSKVPFHDLEKLVLITYDAIRFDDDNDHSDGKVYTPDARDHAQDARSALFKALIDTPGRATFDAIHRLMGHPAFPVPRARLLQLAHRRAATDSERAAWTSADVRDFEADFTTVPRNPFDLQRLLLRKLDDLGYDLLNADYAQGQAFSRLPDEVHVQNWLADWFRRTQGRSYSVEREPHVANEKEPDIRFRAKDSDANVPMEIKVAESWSLKDLETALTDQLVGQYLRDRQNRHGILLLVHQKRRPRGWQMGGGTWLTFEKVVAHLRGMAHTIAADGPDAPQPEIAVLDVSSVGPATTSPKKSRQRRKTAATGGEPSVDRPA